MEENGSLGGVQPYQMNNKRALHDELSYIFVNQQGVHFQPTGAFQVWKKPHLVDNVGGSGSNSGPTKAFTTTTTITPFSVVPNEKQRSEVEFPSFFNGQNTTTQVVPAIDSNINSKQGGEMVDDLHLRFGRKIDPNMDPKKIKRVISNRISAQRSRLRKVQYISDLENTVKSLEVQISSLFPQVARYRNEQHLSQLEHDKLTQQMLVYKNQELLKEVEIEQNKTEVNRLRLIYYKQQQQQQLLQQQQQQQQYFQAPSMVHQIPPELAQGFPSTNQIPNFSATSYQPGLIFPHYLNPNVEFGGSSGDATRSNPAHVQSQTMGSIPMHVQQEMNRMMPNQQQVMMAHHDQAVQDQPSQAWTTVEDLPAPNFIDKWEPKQPMPPYPFCLPTSYNSQFVTKEEQA